MSEHNMGRNLGELINPDRFNEALELKEVALDTLLSMLKDMLVIRIAEDHIGKAVERGLVKTPCHLSIGQEAIAVGISGSLNKGDHVFGTHRSHGHFLAMGGGLYELIAEIFGKADGASKGLGGSMHLYGGDMGFKGSVPIVGATIPIAVGAAMAAKMDGKQSIAVCYFGDGAAEEGVLHESLNLASAHNLPVLFVCENNLYSSHLDIRARQPADSIARFAQAHCIDVVRLDGNDVVQVGGESARAITKIRNECRPYFIEAVTYRWRGHVGPDENIDVGVRRSKKELDAWKLRDPIKRLMLAMIAKGMLTQSDYSRLVMEVDEQVRFAVQKATIAAYPEGERLYDLVYSDTDI